MASHDELIPSLSVIIPVRDGGPTFSCQLAALADQEFDGEWELLVVDNGSSDDSRSQAESFRPRFNKLTVIDASARPGQAYALNVGARSATGDALVFLDADDVVAPGYLAAMCRALTTAPFVGARLDCDSLNPPWARASRPAVQAEALGAPFGFLTSAGGGTLGIRCSVFLDAGGFDATIGPGHDIEFCWRVQLQMASASLQFVPDAVVRCRYHRTLGKIFAQARGYGSAGPALYRRYRQYGMPRRSLRMALRFHAALLVRVASARSRADLAHCVFLLGFRIGIVEGCIKNRVVYL
jgi:glycosyltransferase involved in cell wall biosynthesis